MNFKPDEKNIRSLLKSGCQFVIPRFQREYSWDKKNYQEFFEDMINNLNSSAGQKSYVEKIPCYQKSQYIWIKRFIEVNKDWDEGMINERAETL